MIHRFIQTTYLLLACFSLTVYAAGSDNYRIDWQVFNSGSGSPSSGNYSAIDAIADDSTGNAQSLNYSITGGFLAGINMNAPHITGVWPGGGTVGEYESVFIFGRNFSIDGSTQVFFNDVRQFIVAPVSSDMLIVRLLVDPSLYGPVRVATADGVATSSNDFGVALSGLQITGVWPGNIQAGSPASVFIFGNDFTTDNTTEVYFNGVRQYLVAAVSSELLIVRVVAPDVSLNGPVTITIPGVGTVISSSDLVVTP